FHYASRPRRGRHSLPTRRSSDLSAVETLPLAKTEESRGRLLAVIQHDVRRLDRLISDISDASRLEAEMSEISRSRRRTSCWMTANSRPRLSSVLASGNVSTAERSEERRVGREWRPRRGRLA